jgi:hypothetical protein
MIRVCFYLTAALIVIISSCKKEQSKSTLTGYKDSMSKYEAFYTDGKITVLQSSDGSQRRFEYKDDYVKVTEFPYSSYYEYFLNNSKLPIRIIKHYDSTYKGELNFFYKAGTVILDSAVLTEAWALPIKTKYSFTYSGGNINQISIDYFNADGTVSKNNFSYTYYTAPNIFRSADSLLYIYVNPQADLSFHNILFYFPKIFSASTFKTYSYFDGIKQNGGTLNYTTNSLGKVTKESYNGYGYGYDYFYND